MPLLRVFGGLNAIHQLILHRMHPKLHPGILETRTTHHKAEKKNCFLYIWLLGDQESHVITSDAHQLATKSHIKNSNADALSIKQDGKAVLTCLNPSLLQSNKTERRPKCASSCQPSMTSEAETPEGVLGPALQGLHSPQHELSPRTSSKCRGSAMA